MLRDGYLTNSMAHALRKMWVASSEELQGRVVTGSWGDKHAILFRPASRTYHICERAHTHNKPHKRGMRLDLCGRYYTHYIKRHALYGDTIGKHARTS